MLVVHLNFHASHRVRFLGLPHFHGGALWNELGHLSQLLVETLPSSIMLFQRYLVGLVARSADAGPR